MPQPPESSAPTIDDSGEPAASEHRVAFGQPDAVCVTWLVPPDCHRKTAAELLAFRIKRLGIERAVGVVNSGDLRINQQAVSPDFVVERGMEAQLWRMPPDRISDLVTPPRILLDDRIGSGLVVLDKPGNLAIHPSARYLHNTLTGWLGRQGIVAHPCHRLDRETSGVIVCAAPGDAERSVKMAFMRGEVQKTYLAVVRGHLTSVQHIEAPLGLQGDDGLVHIRMVVRDDGKAASTSVYPLAQQGATTLVRCVPHTGRQHQIRAHLAHVGYPIIGDKLYAMGDAWFDAFTRRALSDEQRHALDHPRQALHAEQLTFQLQGQRLKFVAPVPADFGVWPSFPIDDVDSHARAGG